jgi:hypothetical protein
MPVYRAAAVRGLDVLRKLRAQKSRSGALGVWHERTGVLFGEHQCVVDGTSGQNK